MHQSATAVGSVPGAGPADNRESLDRAIPTVPCRSRGHRRGPVRTRPGRPRRRVRPPGPVPGVLRRRRPLPGRPAGPRPGRASAPRSEVEDDPALQADHPLRDLPLRPAWSSPTPGAGPAASPGSARLRSLGVGGHVAEADAEGRGTLEAYEMALRRELAEEVEVRSPGAIRRVGLINDDSNPVGPGPPRRGPPLRPGPARGRPAARTPWPTPGSSPPPTSRPPRPVRDLVAVLHRRPDRWPGLILRTHRGAFRPTTASAGRVRVVPGARSAGSSIDVAVEAEDLAVAAGVVQGVAGDAPEGLVGLDLVGRPPGLVGGLGVGPGGSAAGRAGPGRPRRPGRPGARSG